MKIIHDNKDHFNNIGNIFYDVMVDKFIVQDLYVTPKKKLIKSDVKPLTCYICKKELNGISITAKMLNGNMIFLCSRHYQSDPHEVVLVN